MFFFSLFVLMFNHILSCIWFLVPKLEGFPLESWVVTGGLSGQR